MTPFHICWQCIKVTFTSNFFAEATWKLSISTLLWLQNSTYENKIDLDAHLKSYISRWLLSLSIILKNIEFKSDFGFGIFFYTPCRTLLDVIFANKEDLVKKTKQWRSKLNNWGGGGHIFIYSCSAQLISFEIDCFHGLWTRIYEYVPPPPPQLSSLPRHWNQSDTLFNTWSWIDNIKKHRPKPCNLCNHKKFQTLQQGCFPSRYSCSSYVSYRYIRRHWWQVKCI